MNYGEKFSDKTATLSNSLIRELPVWRPIEMGELFQSLPVDCMREITSRLGMDCSFLEFALTYGPDLFFELMLWCRKLAAPHVGCVLFYSAGDGIL